ncbi:MAG: hypothetical protein MR364_01990 [Oscillospiraceae bacterium]|nr:hypothetical protein [Oscillospiraceae bacterium]
MSRKKKNNAPVEKRNDDVINELLGEIENDPDIEIEDDVANLGEETDDVKIAELSEESDPKKSRLFFVVAVFILIMAVIGMVSSVKFVVNGISNLADNTALKNEFARFLLPVVANDIAPFEDESEISNSSKVSCSVWNILVNRDTSAYKQSQVGGISIPEYDVSVSCKELFGSNAELKHQTVGSGDLRFNYDAENHVYTCPKDLRYLNYAPKITDMVQDGDNYVLTVDYLPPSITMVADNLGITVDADKTLEYTVNRKNKKNTLISVRLIDIQSNNSAGGN